MKKLLAIAVAAMFASVAVAPAYSAEKKDDKKDKKSASAFPEKQGHKPCFFYVLCLRPGIRDPATRRTAGQAIK